MPIYFDGRHAALEALGRRLRRTFGLEPRIRQPWFDPEVPFHPARGQYNSTLLLAQLLRGLGDEPERVLGVTSVDLFIPVLTFVFGEAQLSGRAAVVSIHRLRSEAYGLDPDERLLTERLDKEAVHELGHTYGLVHCATQDCVMRSSTYVEEIDFKSAEFCASCIEEIAAAR